MLVSPVYLPRLSIDKLTVSVATWVVDCRVHLKVLTMRQLTLFDAFILVYVVYMAIKPCKVETMQYTLHNCIRLNTVNYDKQTALYNSLSDSRCVSAHRKIFNLIFSTVRRTCMLPAFQLICTEILVFNDTK